MRDFFASDTLLFSVVDDVSTPIKGLNDELKKG